jgi:ribosomal protein L37AE/L43A
LRATQEKVKRAATAGRFGPLSGKDQRDQIWEMVDIEK